MAKAGVLDRRLAHRIGRTLPANPRRPCSCCCAAACPDGAVGLAYLVLYPLSQPDVDRYDREIVVVCSEGYTSSLAAASLQELGLHRATDLVGGFDN